MVILEGLGGEIVVRAVSSFGVNQFKLAVNRWSKFMRVEEMEDAHLPGRAGESGKGGGEFMNVEQVGKDEDDSPAMMGTAEITDGLGEVGFAGE